MENKNSLDFGFYNMDCMDGMRYFHDKFFDLAIVDPPYGIRVNHNIGRRSGERRSIYKKVLWDNNPPDNTYFSELFRVSKNQIIWGANYFSMPPTKCFIVWRKPDISENVSFSMLEYAWTSFTSTSKEWIGTNHELDRIHPTQKPVALYEWLLNRFAKQGDKILDTHVGSASSLIACHNLGFEYVGFEIDADYYKSASERLEAVKNQMSIFKEFCEKEEKNDELEI